jgi:hypothetical protein
VTGAGKPPPRPGRTDERMALPPRPNQKTPLSRAAAEPSSEPPVDVELEPPPAELDEPTRELIAKAIAAALGSNGVRISSVPPASSEPPRSSMRVAADVGKAAAVKVGVPGLIGTGALTLLGGLVALWRPEYLVPIVKLLMALHAAQSGTPPVEVGP